MVHFADMCYDNWWQSGGIQPQAEVRRHDLSDGIAYPGLKSQPRKISGFLPTGARLQTDDSKTWVEVRKNGTVHVKGSLIVTGSITVGGSSKFGHAPEDDSPAPTHEFWGEKWDIIDVPEVGITGTMAFNINNKEYQQHTHGGPMVDKYY